MSCKELIDSLRKAGDVKTRALWKDAEAEADRIRSEAKRTLEQLQADGAGRRASLAGAASAEALTDANNRVRSLRLAAEITISGRLYSSAVDSLRRLRDEKNYQEVFETLARELPSLDWRTVRVNPADEPLARVTFPHAEFIPDANISGGMDVSGEGGAIRIVNTFEKRLERAWEGLLPGLIADVYQEVSDGASAKT